MESSSVGLVSSVPSFWILDVWRVGTLDLCRRQISTFLIMQLQGWVWKRLPEGQNSEEQHSELLRVELCKERRGRAGEDGDATGDTLKPTLD